MFALLLSFPLLCLQASGPELPEVLRAEPATTAAWGTAKDSSLGAEQRLEASELIVGRIITLPAAEQLPFLLEAQGAGVLTSDLQAVWRHLDDSWELLETRLIESLLLPLPANKNVVRGALLASGELASSDVGLIEGVSVFLDRQNFAADSRHALHNLTGRQFADRNEFRSWWEASSTLGREAWLESAIQERKAEELDDWRFHLNSNPSHDTILRGLQHSRQEISELALASLKLYDFAGADDATKAAISDAFRVALQDEKVLVQRKALMELVPRFLTGQDALKPLLRALEFGHPSEKQPAARLLKQIQPAAVAWEGVLRGLDGVYPADAEGPVGSENVRIALWASLNFLSANGGAPDVGAVELRLRQALAVENDQDVRGHIHSAIGTVAGESLLTVLEGIVLNADAPQADRTDSLIAMTAISLRVEKTAALAGLLPNLLADVHAPVRRQAIESLSQLGLPEAPLLLMERLSRENEVFLQKRILAALSGKRSAEVLEPLLVFKPADALFDDYRRALVAQIGSDLPAFNRAFEYFDTQADSLFQLELVFRVAESFPLDGLEVADQQAVSRRQAVAVSKYLLRFGVQNGNSNYAEDAVSRLREWIAAEPKNGLWMDYLVDLQLDRGEVAEALQVLPGLLALPDYNLSRKWELGLYALRNAAAGQMLVEGRQLFDLLDGMGEDMPPEWATYAEQLRGHFSELEPAPAEEAPVPEGPTEDSPEDVTGDGSKPPEGGNESPKMATSGL